MLNRKTELIALMNYMRIPILWYTFSLPNYYWENFQNLFGEKPKKITFDNGIEESNESCKKRLKKIAFDNYNKNPDIVDKMFIRKVRLFPQFFFGPDNHHADWY